MAPAAFAVPIGASPSSHDRCVTEHATIGTDLGVDLNEAVEHSHAHCPHKLTVDEAGRSTTHSASIGIVIRWPSHAVPDRGDRRDYSPDRPPSYI
ncbi:hypothetical protein [Devosia rhizoryzae]|uniref:Uncharacterized protein n=1 Tax=Devosia rhizoryzae TaxID=2774137 RepID=A0ABX7C727_9HYPH|nr:hypothetical protein [Devosia rhizoryzae]QQR40072.1 hypothetical protein JI748_03395 [Devosia rhizoryzae]